MFFPFSYSGSAKWISTFSLLPPYWLNSSNAASASSNSYSDFFVGSSLPGFITIFSKSIAPPFTRSISSVKSAFSAFLEPEYPAPFLDHRKIEIQIFLSHADQYDPTAKCRRIDTILECGRKPHRFDTYVKSMMIARNFSHTICEILFTVIFDHARKSKCMVCVLQFFFRNIRNIHFSAFCLCRNRRKHADRSAPITSTLSPFWISALDTP